MYTVGDEFELEVDGYVEYFSCVGEYRYQGVEYLICDNEYGIKKVLYYEQDYIGDDEDSLRMVDDEELEEEILDSFQENMYKTENSSYDYWEEEPEYVNDFETENMDDLDIHNEDDIDFSEVYDEDELEEDIDNFLDDLFDEEEDED